MNISTGSLIFCLLANSWKEVLGNDLSASVSVSQLHLPAFPSQNYHQTRGNISYSGQRARITRSYSRLQNPLFYPMCPHILPVCGILPFVSFHFSPWKLSLLCFLMHTLTFGGGSMWVKENKREGCNAHCPFPPKMEIFTVLYNIFLALAGLLFSWQLCKIAFLRQFITVFYFMFLKLFRTLNQGAFSKWG